MPRVEVETIEITGISPRGAIEKYFKNNAASSSSVSKKKRQVNELGVNKTPRPAEALVNSKDDLLVTKPPSSNSLPLDQNCKKANLQASQDALPEAKSQISNESDALMANAEDVKMAAEFMPQDKKENPNVTRGEQEQEIQNLKRQLSELLVSVTNILENDVFKN